MDKTTAHDRLKQAAADAIANLFADDSVDRTMTRESLEEIREAINERLYTLKTEERGR